MKLYTVQHCVYYSKSVCSVDDFLNSNEPFQDLSRPPQGDAVCIIYGDQIYEINRQNRPKGHEAIVIHPLDA